MLCRLEDNALARVKCFASAPLCRVARCTTGSSFWQLTIVRPAHNNTFVITLLVTLESIAPRPALISRISFLVLEIWSTLSPTAR